MLGHFSCATLTQCCAIKMAAAACAELIRATYPSLDEEIVSYVGSEWLLKPPHYCYSFVQLRIHTASVGLFTF